MRTASWILTPALILGLAGCPGGDNDTETSAATTTNNTTGTTPGTTGTTDDTSTTDPTTSTTERRDADHPSSPGAGVNTRTRAVPWGRWPASR